MMKLQTEADEAEQNREIDAVIALASNPRVTNLAGALEGLDTESAIVLAHRLRELLGLRALDGLRKTIEKAQNYERL